MSNKTVEFYYDYGSTNSYMAYTQLPKLVQRTGATIVYKPALIGGVFKATGNRAPFTVPAKFKWAQADTQRYAEMWGITMKLNPHFPMNTVYLMRGALYAQQQGFLETYNDAIFTAMWVNEKNLTDPAVVTEVLTAAGLPAEPILAATQDADIKQALFDRTAEAVERGLFGMPTFFVGDEMHFGKDRLHFVEMALLKE